MRTSYENRVADRMAEIAGAIVQEPRVPYEAPPYVPSHRAFKTPDIITYGPAAMIECTELLPAYAHVHRGAHHACGGDAQCSRLYDKLEGKMSKYRAIVRNSRLPYVVALNNLSCRNGHDGVMEVLFGNCLQCLQSAGAAEGHMWDTPGLFALATNTPVSAVLHENESGSLLIPNPNADIPAPRDLFRFAQVAELDSPIWDGHVVLHRTGRQPLDALAAAD